MIIKAKKKNMDLQVASVLIFKLIKMKINWKEHNEIIFPNYQEIKSPKALSAMVSYIKHSIDGSPYALAHVCNSLLLVEA